MEPFGQERAPLGRQLLCCAAASEPMGSRELGGGTQAGLVMATVVRISGLSSGPYSSCHSHLHF